MGVDSYQAKGRTLWRADTWVTLPDGTKDRPRQRGFRTKKEADEWVTRQRMASIEGKYTPARRTLTVAKLWEWYEPLCRQKNKSWKTDAGRAKHLNDHLGARRVTTLTLRDIDAYRGRRLAEKSRYKRRPSISSINRETSLLRHMLNEAVRYGDLDRNPIAGMQLLPENNVRDVVISEEQFEQLLAAAEPPLKPILITAWDTGFRKDTILGLRWDEVDLDGKCIRLAVNDSATKKRPPAVTLSDRLVEMLSGLPRSLSGYVFVNPKTGTRWNQIQKMWDRARTAVKLKHVFFHDTRRSFLTHGRRDGIPESVLMRISGHKTRSAFDRYNIVDDSDIREAVELMQQRRAERAALKARNTEEENRQSTG